jgi:DNA polymerase-3 subunit alpha
MSEIELYFSYQCEKGMAWRGLLGQKVYEERLAYESQVIKSMSFCGYFLIVQDILSWARENKILHGPGRGSIGGSLVAYLFGIAWLDPIRYGLYFERFLNPARVSLPDADLDFPAEKRHLIVEYVQKKYGSDHVAHIGTFGTMKAKGAIRDVARTLGYPYEIGDHLSNLVLPPIEGKPQSLEVCFDKVPELARARALKGSPEQDILFWAEQLEDKPRSFGTHASGVIIANSPVSSYVPLSLGKEKQPTSQFEMNTVEECGLVKFDFLGLKALDTIERCLALIKETVGLEIDIQTIPLDSPEVFKLFHTGDLDGVFQFEGSGGIRDLAVKAHPTTLEDLASLNALYRPGPLGSGMVDQYLRVRSGECEPEYKLPMLEKVLSRTAGVLIFQEQVLEICKQLAGYSMAEADVMRKVVGKKKPEEMKLQKTKFVTGMVTNGYSQTEAEDLFSDIETFSGYGFNLSHAILYSFISYQMAWLKAFYPTQFYCSCLTTDSDEYDKIVRYVESCRAHKIKVLPPDVNKSGRSFSVSGNVIRFGLLAIKNIGVAPATAITTERKKKKFTNLLDFTSREGISKINSRQVECLILAGAFDSISEGVSRADLVNLLTKIWDTREELKRYNTKLETYTKKLADYQAREAEIEAGSKKKSFKLPVEPEAPRSPELGDQAEFSMFDCLAKEKELLGFYVSGHPLDDVPELRRNNTSTIRDIKKLGSRTRISLVAVPALIKDLTTKKDKKKMAFMTLEDKTGTIEASVAPKVYAEFEHLVHTTYPMGYTCLAEIVEGIEERVVRLRVTGIHILESQKSIMAAQKKQADAIRATSTAMQMKKIVQTILDRDVKTLETLVEKGELVVHQDEIRVWSIKKNEITIK